MESPGSASLPAPRAGERIRAWLARPAVRLFLVAALLRLSFSVFVLADIDRAFLRGDSESYDKLGVLLIEKHAYSTLGRPPLYPGFLAVTYGVFGHHPEAAIVLQCLLDALTAVLVLQLALALGFTRGLALLAGWFYALFPLPVIFSAQLLSETLFVFLTVLMLLFWVRALDSLRGMSAFASGAFAGLAAVCRTIAIYVPVLLVAGVFFLRSSTWKQKTVLALLLIGGFVLCAGPVIGYNGVRYGMWSTSSIGGIALYCFNAAGALELAKGMNLIEYIYHPAPYYDSQVELWNKIRNKYGWKEEFHFQIMDDAKKTAIMRGEAFRIMLPNMHWTILSHLLGAVRCLDATPMTSPVAKITRGGASHAIIVSLALLLYGVGIGMALLGVWPRQRPPAERPPYRARLAATVIFLVGFYFLAATGAGGHSRYLMPAVPLIALLGARALAPGSILSRLRGKRAAGS